MIIVIIKMFLSMLVMCMKILCQSTQRAIYIYKSLQWWGDSFQKIFSLQDLKILSFDDDDDDNITSIRSNIKGNI